MPHAILLREHGGPEVLRFESISVSEPGPNEIRLRHTAIGVNFHDIYVRTGLYQTLPLPGIPGVEAVGVVEELDSQVKDLAVGDRVGYITGAYGAYAEERIINSNLVVRIPDEIDDRVAAASLVKGLTVCMLLNKVHTLKAGDTCLIHAAAGGVGSLLCQWAHHIGAHVIGTVGSDKKALIAKQNGCNEVIIYSRENVVDRVRNLTKGNGVNVVYDSVGKDTFAGSLDSLAKLGHLVNFGQSSGPVEPFAVSTLAAKSTTLSRPILFHYIENRAILREMADRVFQAIETGVIKAHIAAEFPLKDVAEAQRVIESRALAGSIILHT